MSLCMTLFVGKASAQWTVVDPTNLAQGIVNSCREIVQTSTTAENMINNFKETVKIYEQGKKYYDALKSVNNLVRDARKVQQTIVMVGDITDIYVRLHETAGGIDGRTERTEDGRKHLDALHDRQGQDGRG